MRRGLIFCSRRSGTDLLSGLARDDRVASGIWIKINRKYDPPKQPKVASTAVDADEASEGLLKTSTAEKVALGETDPDVPTSRIKQGTRRSELELRSGHPGTDASRCSGAVLMQYVVPVAIPAVAAILLAPFVEGDRRLGGLTISASRPAALTR